MPPLAIHRIAAPSADGAERSAPPSPDGGYGAPVPADETDQLPSGTIQYEAEPARLAWPLRWLSPPGGFAMNSLRGLRIPSHAGH